MSEWQGKVCVVTGAGSGIGGGLARHAASLGMHVIGTDVDKAGLTELEHTLHARGLSIETRRVDVRDAQAVEELAHEVFERHDRVNLLFNNAGVLVDGKSWERPLRDWHWSFDVNVFGVIHGIRSFVPRMLTQGEAGRIINTSSQGGLLGGGTFMAPYQASKHAVTAITETLHAELALEPAPISASCLCPGEVATRIWSSDRLRPEQEHSHLGSSSERQFHDAVASAVDEGSTPDAFAAEVFAAIDKGRFWIVPTGEFFRSTFAARNRSILEGL